MSFDEDYSNRKDHRQPYRRSQRAWAATTEFALATRLFNRTRGNREAEQDFRLWQKEGERLD